MSTKQGSQKSFSPGDIIMKQGDEGDCAYIIEEGEVEIIVEKPDGSEQIVGKRGPGTIIGEMAIVDNASRTATVKATKDCQMLQISRDDFSQRLKSADPVIQMISQVILTRYRDLLTRADIIGDSTARNAEELERDYASQIDVIETIKIANEFKEALDKNQLHLHYQPIVDLKQGVIKGFEALMRWNHSEKGFISPGVFIPVAEKSGLIVEASRWALLESCEALRRIEQATGKQDELYMSVNFSSTDFTDPEFIENVNKTLSQTGVKAHQIKLEITERLLIQQPDNAKDVLQICRDAGMGVSIDDFGTGYSSLSYLYYFPINTLKIDQSFIRAMHKEIASMQLVESIIGLGQNMNMDVVAEGVEEVEEAKILQDLGCDNAQGYYFGRPVSEEEIIKVLTEWEPFKLSA
jgi:EAL domain-containing protein (putative c-di-GMP-specific phosphodiesterase class I)